jgi:hypothetical protein
MIKARVEPNGLKYEQERMPETRQALHWRHRFDRNPFNRSDPLSVFLPGSLTERLKGHQISAELRGMYDGIMVECDAWNDDGKTAFVD